TGCDSGFGHAMAKYLDKMGFIVFAGVLNEKGPGAEELKSNCSARLSVIQLDITNSTQIEKAYTLIKAKVNDNGLWGIVNNAGVLECVADGELLPMSIYRRCMDVNFFGTVEVSKVFCPLLHKAKGRLINMASMAGEVPMPLFAAYGCSKAALCMFSGVMRQELSRWGVKVVTIQPGGFKTGISGTSDNWNTQDVKILKNLSADVRKEYGEEYILSFKDLLPVLFARSSQDLSPVLSDIYHSLMAKNPKHVYTPGKGTTIFYFLYHYAPVWFYDSFVTKAIMTSKTLPAGVSRVLKTEN
uniref:Hydroxysteroid 17-beta dehydrogenase 2 n=2 Tax=Latimeria chalumnae TaxID=7897 RepID=H3A7N1_LATCH